VGRIEDLSDRYLQHISTPWQRTVSGAQRVLVVVYDKELERTLRARKMAFENATRQADHDWVEVDLTDAFPQWMAADDYRDAYFESPEDLSMKLDSEFSDYVAARIRAALTLPEVDHDTVVAVFGVGTLFGLTRMSRVLKLVESDIRGRLAIFFPGSFDRNNYRLLDARDGWNYMAVPITLHGTGETA